MHASLRAGLDPMALERRVWNGKEEHRPDEKDVRVEDASIVKHSPMSIFYGSNSGTCESLAQSLANHASSRGYHAEVQNMDSAADKIPKDHPVIFVTSSYEGEPPDNAARFIKWLEELKGGELAGASFAVFGCGHREWVEISLNAFRLI